MKKKILNSDEISALENAPVGVEIDFTTLNELNFKAKNIVDSVLTGNISIKHLFNEINVIHSVFSDCSAVSVDFKLVDFKDCSLRNFKFENCEFDNAVHINNSMLNGTYINCKFYNTSINDSEYFNVVFEDCDFTNTIISTCKFSNCKFIRCKTSNKLIESSLILECLFAEMIINAETIVENFGITIYSLQKCVIRSIDNQSEKHNPPEQITSDFLMHVPTEIEKFLIQYFLDPAILIDGDDLVDATFDVNNWLKLSKNPNKFRLLIERYHEFLMYNYEKDLLPFWMILKMHKMTDYLAREMETGKIDLYRSIMGVHMSLSRLVEDFLRIMDFQLKLWIHDGKAILLVNGPLEKEFYYNELSEVFQNRSLQIEKVIKHNSPNEIHILWEKINDLLPLISLFLATRVKIGIQKIVIPNEPTSAISYTETGKEERITGSTTMDIIQTQLGFDKQVNNYMFKLRAILPGDLLLNLHIELRTKIFGKIKKIIVGIIPAKSETAK